MNRGVEIVFLVDDKDRSLIKTQVVRGYTYGNNRGDGQIYK